MRKIFSIRLIICAAALAMALGVGIFFIYTLVLRTEYKNAALDMNEPFRQSASVTLLRGDESFSVPTDQVEYYNTFLLDQNTTVFSKKQVPETEGTITLEPSEGTQTGNLSILISNPKANDEKEKNLLVKNSQTQEENLLAIVFSKILHPNTEMPRYASAR